MTHSSTITRRLLLTVIALAMIVLNTQCETAKPAAATPEPAVKPAPATPIDAKKAELGERVWNPEWDAVVERLLPPQMLSRQVPRDVEHFCPRFYDMSETNKRAFWAYFFQALAGAEAGLNPKSRAHHTQPEVDTRDEVSGMYGRTEGLLQLTYADQKRYGCDFDWKRDRTLPPNQRSILQPENNLDCGIKILANQIIDQRKPLLSRSSYWSTLQPGTLSYRVFAKQMTNPPAACGLKVRSTHVTPATTTATVKAQAEQAKSPQ